MFRLNIAYFITHCPHITKRYIWVFRLNIAYFITLAVLVHRREAGTVPPKITVIKPNNDKSDRVSGVLSRFLWLVYMITCEMFQVCRHQNKDRAYYFIFWRVLVPFIGVKLVQFRQRLYLMLQFMTAVNR